MKNIRAEACRDLHRGSFKKANIFACLAAIVALAGLSVAERAAYLPGQMSTARILLCAVMAYGLVFAAMMWIPGRALKKSRSLDDAEASAIPRSQA
jgi:hypothetical protein